MHEFIRKLRSSDYVRHVGRLVRGNLFAQILQLAALPFISRLYTPAEFGMVTLFVAFAGFATVLLTLRYESALLIAVENDVTSLGQLSFLLNVVVASGAAAILYVFIEFAILGHSILPYVAVPLMWVALLGYGSFNIGRAVALRKGETGAIAGARVIRAGTSALTKIGLGLAGLTSIGLIIGELVGAWVASSKVKAGSLIVSGLQKFSWSNVKLVARRYSKFSTLELPSSAINQLAIALPIPMLASIGGAEAAGAYGVARMVVAVPNSQVGNAVADAFQLRVAELVRNRKHAEITGVLGMTFKSLLLVGFLPYLAIAVLSPWAFPFVLGQQWEQAGTFASMISIWMYLALAVGSVSRLLSAVQRQDLKLYYDITCLLLVSSVYIAALHYMWSAYFFLGGIVVVSVVAYLIYLFIIFKAAANVGDPGAFGE